MSEIWFRNPHNYVKEYVEASGPWNVVWDRGILIKKRIDPQLHGLTYFGKNERWRSIAIGKQGAVEVGPNNGLSNPVGVYPVWHHDEEMAILEEMMAEPWGQSIEACTADVPSDERPVFNQEHRVIIASTPNAHHVSSRPFFRQLRELQEEYPECILHIHNLYSYRMAFSMGFASADLEPRTEAAHGKVVLPTGKSVPYERTVKQLEWINILNMSVTDLKIPRNRCIYNIRSARWAAENFTKNLVFKTRGKTKVDPDDPSPPSVVSTSAAVRQSLKLAEDGDKITCDACSLAVECRYFRVGAVCSLPESETNSLAKVFNSRDSSRIIDGLGTILSAQATRLERGMVSEEEFGELDPEVTKMMNQMFQNGVKLAKLIDPSLSKPMVSINNGGSASTVAGSNPKEIMASVVRAIEDSGVPRDQITGEMVENFIRKMMPQASAIEGSVVNE